MHHVSYNVCLLCLLTRSSGLYGISSTTLDKAPCRSPTVVCCRAAVRFVPPVRSRAEAEAGALDLRTRRTEAVRWHYDGSDTARYISNPRLLQYHRQTMGGGPAGKFFSALTKRTIALLAASAASRQLSLCLTVVLRLAAI